MPNKIATPVLFCSVGRRQSGGHAVFKPLAAIVLLSTRNQPRILLFLSSIPQLDSQCPVRATGTFQSFLRVDSMSRGSDIHMRQ